VPLARARPIAALLCFALSLLAVALPRTALAWVEMHVAKDDVRVVVHKDGSARVEHKILLLVSGGPLKSFTIRGVDPDAALDDGAYILSEQDDKSGSLEHGAPLALKRVTAEGVERTDLVVDIDGGRGVSRGRYVAVLRYKTNLLERGLLRVEGATARVDWIGPAWEDGLETTRAWFHFPTAPLEPKAIDPDEGNDEAGGYTFLTTVSRRPEADVLEVVRPYASRGERVVWSVRFDKTALAVDVARALPAEQAGPGDPKPARAPLRLVGSPKDTLFLVGALALFALIATLVAAHALEVRRRAAAREQRPRPLVPLPIGARAIAAGALFLGGLWLQLTRPSSLLGAATVASVALFVWHRPVVAKPALRGPGAWLCLRVDEAFAAARPRPRGLFVATSLPGALALTVLFTAFGAAAWRVSQHSIYHAILVALDVIPLLSLFLSGRDASLAPDPAVDSIPLLREVVRRVERRSKVAVRVVPRVRIPSGQPDPDELRVVFLPREPARGLRAIEVAVAFAGGPGGYVALPEVLLRFEEGSACDEHVQHLEPYGRAQRGRKADERVLSLAPKLPTAALTADLVVAVLERTTAPRVVDVPPPKSRRAPARARRDDAPPATAATAG
jgi:hypothetical protein